MGSRTKAWVTMAAAVLAGTLAVAKPAEAQQPVQPKVTIEATTSPKNLAGDLLMAGDARSIMTAGDWTLITEGNRNFKEGTDFASLGYKMKRGTWDLAPAVRLNNAGLREGSLYAGRQLGAGRINLVGVAAGDHFGMIRSWYNGSSVDLGAALKTYDWSKGGIATDAILGAHTKSGTAGAWVSMSADRDYGIATTLDREGFGVLGLGQYTPKTGSHLALVQLSAGKDGGRMGNIFTPEVGFACAKDLGGQTVHPFAGPADSYLVAGGKYGAEIAVIHTGDADYKQVQFGGRAYTFRNGSALYLGAGLRDDGSPITEGVYNMPAGTTLKNTGLKLELRVAPDPTASIRLSHQF